MTVLGYLWRSFGEKVKRRTLNLIYTAKNGKSSDRGMRDELEELWEYEIPVMNLSDGEGYFLPNRQRLVYRYYIQEVARRNKINRKLAVIEKLKMDMAYFSFENEAEEEKFLRAWIGKRIDEYKRKAPVEAGTSDKRNENKSTTA